MKLRLNLGVQDLGYRFGIHASTVSRYFSKWIDVIYVRLSSFIAWPERHLLLKTMPMAFKKSYNKCTIIIDCFEIFTERSTALDVSFLMYNDLLTLTRRIQDKYIDVRFTTKVRLLTR